MKGLIAFILIGAAGSAQLRAQAWRKPEEKWTKKDAGSVLTSSPWAKRAVARPEAPGRSAMTKVTVRWESARPVKAARRKLGLRPAAGDEFYYALGVLGLDTSFLQKDGATPQAQLLRLASLRYADEQGIAPVDARIVEQDQERPLILFLFPRRADIATPSLFRLPFGLATHEKYFEFTARINDTRITQKFLLREMLCLHNLEL